MTTISRNARLEGVRAVVTGGASGIGLAAARRFLSEGAEVMIWDVVPQRVFEVTEELRGEGLPAHGLVVDVSDPESVTNGARETGELFDTGVTVLMNNAGILDGYLPLLETSEALWDKIFDVNLKGMFLVTKALLPSMIRAGGGAIVNTASISGSIADGGGIAYTSSKHAVVGFTKQMASDYAGLNIRVNAIAPGAVQTRMGDSVTADEGLDVHAAIASTPAGRWADANEIANVALFLASKEASFVHGAIYAVDGGWTVR